MDRAEYKLIDKLKVLSYTHINDVVNCTPDECGDLLTRYFKHRKVINSKVVDLSAIPNIDSLYDIKRINGDFSGYFSSLSDLGNLRVVHGRVELVKTPIHTLGKLMYCAGLVIKSTSILEIPNLSEVNGSVEIANSPLKDLGALNLIGGDFNLYGLPNLTSLGKVASVFNNVIIDKCPNLVSLHNLRSVGGSLDIREMKLQNLGKLNDIGGFIISKKSKMSDISDSGLEELDLSPLSDFFPTFPKATFVKVPKIDNLHDFGLIIIDDMDDSGNIYNI